MARITTNIKQAIAVIQQGGVIAYPTESMFGLGCAANNKNAVNRIQKIKQREPEKGVITLVMDLTQVSAWLDDDYQHLWSQAEHSWPAPITWLFPCSVQAPQWLTGGSSQIALRCPDHLLAQSLCRHTPTISTSANASGQPPAATAQQVVEYFDDTIDLILQGDCGQQTQPSQIIDLVSGKILR